MSTGIKLSAHDFLGKLRKAEEGQVYSGLADWANDIRLLVVEPQEEKGIFLAPSATTFKSSEAYVMFVREIYQLTELSPISASISASRNRVIRKPKNMKRISVRQFINRLKHAEDGEIKLGHVSDNFEIALIVTDPAGIRGTFMAPRIDAFDYDFGWYSEFIGEILKLVMTPPEERKTLKIRTLLPWIEEFDDWENRGNDDGPDQG